MTIKDLFTLNFNSKLLRKVLSNVYKEGKVYKPIFGPLQSKELHYRKDINFHAMIGIWEKDSFWVLNKIIDGNLLQDDDKPVVFTDIGANIGYYSIFFEKALGDNVRIQAFEPAAILEVLNKNINSNNKHTEIFEMAVSDKTGEITFYEGPHHHQSSVLGDWSHNAELGTQVTVQSTCLNDFYMDERKGENLPDLIKIDVEGAAGYVFNGADKLFSAKRPFVLIESHIVEEDNAICDFLNKYDYQAFRTKTKDWVKNRSANYTDPDGVCGTMLLVPSHKFERTKEVLGG
ncbi:MAG: FkbM family methyltransferase [Bacteroidia bacterium]|nr:FkbM family methyltransferase [Bacteroidia bacterium]